MSISKLKICILLYLLEICSKHKCNYQGEQCYMDEDTLKPFCKCTNQCPLNVNSICVELPNGRTKTFINKCMMEREACTRKETYKLLYERKCDAKVKEGLSCFQFVYFDTWLSP